MNQTLKLEDVAEAEIVAPAYEVTVFEPFRARIEDLKKENASLHFDYESKDGNKEARSYVYKLRQSKTAVDDARKNATKDLREQVAKVNDAGNVIIQEIQGMIDFHDTKLKEVEAKEEKRVEALKARVASIEVNPDHLHGHSLERLNEIRKHIDETVIDESWEEYSTVAERTQLKSLQHIDMAIKAREEQIARDKELEALRISDAINRIRMIPVDMVGKSADETEMAIRSVETIKDPEAFGDRIEEAKGYFADTLSKLRNMHAAAVESEAKPTGGDLAGHEVSGAVIDEAEALPEWHKKAHQAHVSAVPGGDHADAPNPGVPEKFAPQPAANQMVVRAEERYHAAVIAVTEKLMWFGVDEALSHKIAASISDGSFPHVRLVA